MKRAKPVIAILLGAFFAATGVAKLCDVQRLADAYRAGGHPRWVFFLSGLIEALAGVAMFVPRFRRHAAWSLLAMIFVVSWASWKVSDPFFLLPQVATIAALAFSVATAESHAGLGAAEARLRRSLP